MIGIVREVHRDPREQILEALARHQIAVFQRRLAELGQLGIARPVDDDADPALVLPDVVQQRCGRRRPLCCRSRGPCMQPNFCRFCAFAVTRTGPWGSLRSRTAGSAKLSTAASSGVTAWDTSVIPSLSPFSPIFRAVDMKNVQNHNILCVAGISLQNLCERQVADCIGM